MRLSPTEATKGPGGEAIGWTSGRRSIQTGAEMTDEVTLKMRMTEAVMV